MTIILVSQFITISEAAQLVNKSSQTIRRLLKLRRVKFRRNNTPQGFNYVIEKNSLMEYFGVINQERGDLSTAVPAATRSVAGDGFPRFTPESVQSGTSSFSPYSPAAALPHSPHQFAEIDENTADEDQNNDENEDRVNPFDNADFSPATVENGEIIDAGLQKIPEESFTTMLFSPEHEAKSHSSAHTNPASVSDPASSSKVVVDAAVNPVEASDISPASPSEKTSEISQNTAEVFTHFNATMQNLISQHEQILRAYEEDKRNLFHLAETFQSRIIQLENQIRQLEAPKRRWFEFWK